MTRVSIFKDNNGNVLKYIVEGHSGFAQSGEDIVCAAISILAHTTYASIIKVCNIPEEDVFIKVCDEDGYFELSIPDYIDNDMLDKAQTVFQVMEVGMKQLLEVYPKYITLEYGEV
ncbi:ribosomal-processing cysteine protease Prp [Sporosalibacterium faouarense]|uniref:ribosomal-processing cysteine protease Prp n=1 Tax=Sporosalibacterium faouarense TaxID=516123 RepID=UPI00192B81C1|nr:ribosomal-processing cysteine protease Prp [Sporosalibacterium faouarense]